MLRRESYVETVCQQIRWKKAHAFVGEEIANHITDQKNAFIKQGMDENTAEELSVLEMGDPVAVGTQLDRTHRPKPQWGMVLLVLGILVLNILIRLILIEQINNSTFGNIAIGSLPNMILSLFMGLGFMTIAYFLDFTILAKFPRLLFGGLICVTLLLMFLSPVTRGVPIYAPYVLFVFPTVYAGILYKMRAKRYFGIFLCGIFLAIPAVLGLLIPSFTSAIVFSLAGLALLLIAVCKEWFGITKRMGLLIIAVTIVFVLTVVAVYIMASNYRIYRISNMVYPYENPSAQGYVGNMVCSIVSNASLIGSSSTDFVRLLPYVETEFFLTYIIGMYGWLAFIFVIGLLSTFISWGFILCKRQKSVLGQLVASSVLLVFSAQVILCVLTNVGLIVLPTALPLFSYGNSFSSIQLFLVGLLLSVFRTGHVVCDKNKVNSTTAKKFMTWKDGALTLKFK